MNSALDRGNGLVHAWHAELFDVGAALLARAQRSGAVIADADAADVLKMVGAIAWAAQDNPDSPAQADRLLALLLNGLLATGDNQPAAVNERPRGGAGPGVAGSF